MWFLSVSEFVGPSMQASPELVRFRMWPLFHLQRYFFPEFIMITFICQAMEKKMSR